MPRRKREIVDGKLPCAKCKEWKPVEAFVRDSQQSSGFACRCRECMGCKKGRYDIGRPATQQLIDGCLTCRTCGETKLLDQFEKNKACYHGRAYRCRTCAGKKAIESQSRTMRNFLMQWCRPSHGHLKRSGKRSLPTFSREMLQIDKLMALYEAQGGRCAVTGLKLTHKKGNGRCWTNASIDRIENTKGYEPGNVRLVCVAVNLIRHEMTDDEMYWWAKKLIQTRQRKRNVQPRRSSHFRAAGSGA